MFRIYNYSKLLFLLMLVMMTGSLLSRALLSVSMIAFLLAAFSQIKSFRQLIDVFRNPLLAGMALLFFIPFVSGLWSSNLFAWSGIIISKLPFLLFPIAFSTSWNLSRRQWQYLAVFFILLLLVSTGWSMSVYLSDISIINESYLKAKTIPVPMDNDHVRFSWMVCTGVIIGLMLFNKVVKPVLKILSLFAVTWFVVYLHILAARTGLFACYLLLAAYCIYLLIKSPDKKAGIAALTVVLIIVTVAWTLFPTLQNRFRYIRYNYELIRDDKYISGGTDVNRVLSFKAGWKILQEHPLGIGAGDVKDKVNKWYDEQVPGVLEQDKIFPSNEWLIHGDMAGWPAVLLFSLAVVLPFFNKQISDRFFWTGLHLVALFAFMVDSCLEVQFGIFIYTFSTLCWWKWVQSQKR